MDGDFTCYHCDGSGYIVTCWDDLCNSAGYCMHDDDGEIPCPHCNDDGAIIPVNPNEIRH